MCHQPKCLPTPLPLYWEASHITAVPHFTGAPITLGSLPESQYISYLALISNPPSLITDQQLTTQQQCNLIKRQYSSNTKPYSYPQAPSPLCMLSPGPGLQAISKKLYDAIQAGSYVDFAQFPAAKGWSIPPSSLEGHILVLIQASELVQAEASARLCYLDSVLCYIICSHHCTRTWMKSTVDSLHAQYCEGKY